MRNAIDWMRNAIGVALERYLARVGLILFFDLGSDAPTPDPNIGLAAMKNADIADAALQLGREQIAWNKDQWAQTQPLVQAAAEQQLAIGDQALAQSKDQWGRYQSTFAPAEEAYAKEAMGYGTEADQEAQAQAARSDVAGSFEAQRGATERDLARSGVNPNSPAAIAARTTSGNVQAAAEAGAANTTRRNVRLQGIAMRQGLSQFGRNMPQTGMAASGLSLQGTSAGVGTLNNQQQTYNAGINSAVPWYSGATTANTAAGNLYLGQYDAQMKGYQADRKANSEMFSSIGNLAGMMYGAAKGGIVRGGKFARNGYAKGGMVRGASCSHMASGGVVRKFEEGGMVRGPGDGSVDTVPAMIDGTKPAALANGEAVLNAPAVKIVGEDFVHRINALGLAVRDMARRGVGQPKMIQGEPA